MKIIVVANKWWEAAPLVSIFEHMSARQPDWSAVPIEICDARQLGSGGAATPAPRLIANIGFVDVEIWCIQDLMDPEENSSLTWEKARVLPWAIRDPDEEIVVIAFGTAACPLGSGQNGSVIVGTSVFVHDPYKEPPNPKKHWSHALLNQVVVSPVQSVLDSLPRHFIEHAERRFLTPPNGSAAPPTVQADSRLVSIGVVNVTSSADYAWADRQALDSFEDITGSKLTESLETTHGVIRLVLDKPFLYVSGLANAVGKFPEHVGQNPYAQNFAATHNAAIALAWLLPELIVGVSGRKMR